MLMTPIGHTAQASGTMTLAVDNVTVLNKPESVFAETLNAV